MLNQAEVISGALLSIDRYEQDSFLSQQTVQYDKPMLFDDDAAQCSTFDDFSIYHQDQADTVKPGEIRTTDPLSYTETCTDLTNELVEFSDGKTLQPFPTLEDVVSRYEGDTNDVGFFPGTDRAISGVTSTNRKWLELPIETSDVSTSESESESERSFVDINTITAIPTHITKGDVNKGVEGGDLKRSLKDKIRLRRESEGQREIPSAELFEPPKQYELTPEEETKNEQRKARNRKSATKSRLKRIERENKLEKEAEDEEEKNAELLREVKVLKHMKQLLAVKLATHLQTGKCCKRKNNYFPNATPVTSSAGGPCKVQKLHIAVPPKVQSTTTITAFQPNPQPTQPVIITPPLATSTCNLSSCGNNFRVPSCHAITTASTHNNIPSMSPNIIGVDSTSGRVIDSMTGTALSVSSCNVTGTVNVESPATLSVPLTPNSPPSYSNSTNYQTINTAVAKTTKEEEVRKIRESLLDGFKPRDSTTGFTGAPVDVIS